MLIVIAIIVAFIIMLIGVHIANVCRAASLYFISVLAAVIIGGIMLTEIPKAYYALNPRTPSKEVLEEQADNIYLTKKFDSNNKQVYQMQMNGSKMVTIPEEDVILHYSAEEDPYVLVSAPSAGENLWLYGLEKDTVYEIYLNDESQQD